MTVAVLVGAQWGDEGKGKVLDVLGPRADLLVHYAGGGNPGQTIAVRGERIVLHLAPPGPLRDGRTCLLGQGMAIDPRVLLAELDALRQAGALRGDLLVCERAHVVLPHHVQLDRLRGEDTGASGAPRRGVGPCYGDKVARRGVQMGDLLAPERLEKKLLEAMEAAAPLVRALGGEPQEPEPILEEYTRMGEALAPHVVDGSRHIAGVIFDEGTVLIEGLLGTMVDMDHGSYPFVVGASTVAGGACAGAGIAPTQIDRVLGVAKAYTTRPGPGPFVPEVSGDLAAHLSRAGGELAPATGSPRRIGMFDVPVLRYAARVNGFRSFALTKLDVLSGLDEVPICLGYELDGEIHDEPPFQGMSRAVPKVEMIPGWSQPLADCRRYEHLPLNARRYIETITEAAGVKVFMIGVGPAPGQTILVDDPLS